MKLKPNYRTIGLYFGLNLLSISSLFWWPNCNSQNFTNSYRLIELINIISTFSTIVFVTIVLTRRQTDDNNFRKALCDLIDSWISLFRMLHSETVLPFTQKKEGLNRKKILAEIKYLNNDLRLIAELLVKKGCIQAEKDLLSLIIDYKQTITDDDFIDATTEYSDSTITGIQDAYHKTLNLVTSFKFKLYE